MSYSVAQNTSFLTAASVLQKIISFAYFIFIASKIGVLNTGSYTFAISITTVFIVLADFGFTQVLTREASKFPEKSQHYFDTVISSKILFGIGAYVLVILFANVLNYAPQLKLFIYISGVTMFFDNLQTGFLSIFRANKNLKYESVVVIAVQAANLLIGTAAVFLKAPLGWLIAAYTIPSILIVFVSAFYVNRTYGVRYHFVIDRAVLRQFAIFGFPFAVAAFLGRLYSYSDSILISKLLTAENLGWWVVPYKIAYAFQFVPTALSASVYPVFSSLTISAPDKIGELFVKAWKYLFVIVFPLSFGLIALASPVVIHFFGHNYEQSIPVLRISMLSLIFSYLAIITGALLNATNHQKTQTGLIATALISNIALNLLLIPSFGIVGAAYSALFSNLLLWALGFAYARKYVVFSSLTVLKSGIKILLLALIMSILVYLLNQHFSIYITIPLGILIYGLLLVAAGTIDRNNITGLWGKLSIKNQL